MQIPLGPELLAILERFRPESMEQLGPLESGAKAFVVIDSTRLGPAAGGVRTLTYADDATALEDACRLAQAMTIKCAIAGLDAGGAKIVVSNVGEDRAHTFASLGELVDSHRGQLRTGGDLGTTVDDLQVMATKTRYVHTDSANLASAVARGVLRCAEACADDRGRPTLSGLRVAVQGAGTIGAAVARALHAAGAEVAIADVVDEKARAVAAELGAQVLAPGDVLLGEVDIVLPCAIGGVLTPEIAGALRAWAVVPGANTVCSEPDVHRILHERGISMVPDVVSSAGGVIEGVGRTVMGLEDRGPLIDALGETARAILADARRTGEPPQRHALARARARMASVPRARGD